MRVRAVFFDFMGTLAHFIPEQEDLLVAAAAANGITVSLQAARCGFASAAAWWNQRVSELSLDDRTQAEKEGLYKAFDLRVLQAAGANASEELAYQIFREIIRQSKGSRLAVFEDVAPALQDLQKHGTTLGTISNMNRTLPRTLAALGVDHYMGIVVSSGEVGISKPEPGIFQVALVRAGVAPEEAIYVGDQYENDVLGARRAGLTPILADRYDLFPHFTDCIRVRSLREIANRLESI